MFRLFNKQHRLPLFVSIPKCCVNAGRVRVTARHYATFPDPNKKQQFPFPPSFPPKFTSAKYDSNTVPIVAFELGYKYYRFIGIACVAQFALAILVFVPFFVWKAQEKEDKETQKKLYKLSCALSAWGFAVILIARYFFRRNVIELSLLAGGNDIRIKTLSLFGRLKNHDFNSTEISLPKQTLEEQAKNPRNNWVVMKVYGKKKIETYVLDKTGSVKDPVLFERIVNAQIGTKKQNTTSTTGHGNSNSNSQNGNNHANTPEIHKNTTPTTTSTSTTPPSNNSASSNSNTHTHHTHTRNTSSKKNKKRR